MRGAAAIVLAAFLLLRATAATATVVCVSTTDGPFGLRAKLAEWETSTDSTYTIELVQGTYAYPYYDGWGQNYGTGTAALQLLGGFNSGCNGRVLVASNTVLDGSGNSTSFFGVRGSGSVLVEGITFRSLGDGAAVTSYSSDAADSVVVRYIVGSDLLSDLSLQQQGYSGFYVGGQSAVRVESSLFHGVHGGDASAALSVDCSFPNANAVITNVTSANNDARGLYMGCQDFGDGHGIVNAYNVILWNNTSGDLDTRGAASKPLIDYSDFDPSRVAGTYTTAASTNINADPQFNAPGAGDFSLSGSSPAINIGAPEFIVQGGYGSQDIDGGTRVVGGVIDLGAYESLVNAQIAQTVTSTLDDGSIGTLRAAIVAANSNPNATPINFNLGDANSCPRTITLSQPLDDITTDMTIDGYSESGAAHNTLFGDYDGKICVIVKAADNAVTHALRVGAGGRLTVKGIEFEGFSTAAVRLAGGDGSIVVGNGFSAMPGATANDVGVLIEGTATGSLIGSTSVSDRNVFNMGTAAIDFEYNGISGGHVVEGNYLGLNFDGTSWLGTRSTYGLYVQGSGGNTIRSNFIGRALNEGIHLSGASTTANTLATNFVGEAPGGASVGNGSAGILITSGAHDNVIGTANYQTQSGGGNYILDNFGPGIWLDPTAGSHNRIDGNNSIHDNSGFLPIDLGAASDVAGLGPTADDSKDTDSGPNGLVNFPYLTQATRFEANKIALDGYLLAEYIGSAQTYRLDVFWTDTCLYPDVTKPSDRPRGDMKRYVGYFFVAVDPNTSFKAFPSTTITAPKTIPGSGYLFATATDAAGNTSEPGKCFAFYDDYIFTNGFN